MKNVAVIGASADRSKFGNKAVRAFLQQGHTVYPINLKETHIEGQKAYRSVADVPGDLDIITVYVPPSLLLQILPDIAAKGCKELWINPGADSEVVLSRAEELGLPVIQACSIMGVGVSPEEL